MSRFHSLSSSLSSSHLSFSSFSNHHTTTSTLTSTAASIPRTTTARRDPSSSVATIRSRAMRLPQLCNPGRRPAVTDSMVPPNRSFPSSASLASNMMSATPSSISNNATMPNHSTALGSSATATNASRSHPHPFESSFSSNGTSFAHSASAPATSFVNPCGAVGAGLPALRGLPQKQLAPETVINRLKLQAANARRSGAFSEALSLYSEALLLCPRSPSLLCHRAMVHFSLGSLDDSLQDALDAVQMEPSYSRAYYNLARILQALHRERDSVRACEVAAKLEPRNEDYASMLQSLMKREGVPQSIVPSASNPFGSIPLPCPLQPIEYRFVVNVHADGSILTADDVLQGISVSPCGRSLSICRDTESVEVWQRICPTPHDALPLDAGIKRHDELMNKKPQMEKALCGRSHIRIEIALSGRLQGLLALYWLRGSGRFVGWHVEWRDYDHMCWMIPAATLDKFLAEEPICAVQELQDGLLLPFNCESPLMGHGLMSSGSTSFLTNLASEAENDDEEEDWLGAHADDKLTRLTDCRTSIQSTAFEAAHMVGMSIRGQRLRVFSSAREIVIRHGYNITSRVLSDLQSVDILDHEDLIRPTSTDPYCNIRGSADRAFSFQNIHPLTCPQSTAPSTSTGMAPTGLYNVETMAVYPQTAQTTILQSHVQRPSLNRPSQKHREMQPQHRLTDELLMVAIHAGKQGVFCGTWGGDGKFYGCSC